MSGPRLHCWHSHGPALLTDPPQYHQVCCHCGETRIRRDIGQELVGHGPFLSTDGKTVRVKVDLEAELNAMLEAVSEASGLTKQQIIRKGLGLPEDLRREERHE